MTCQSMQELIPQVVFIVLRIIGEENEFSHAAIFDVKFCKKPEKVVTDSRGRTTDALFMNLESVAWAIQSSNLSITEDNFVPSARCFQDTKKRQQVTRASFQRLRCCVCHIHHEQAMRAPYRVRQFFREST